MRSLKARILLTVLLSVGIGFLAVAAAATQVVSQALQREADSGLRDVASNIASGADLDRDGTLVVAREPDAVQYAEIGSGWYWAVSDGARTIARSRSLWTDTLIVPAGAGARFLDGPRGERLRAVAVQTEMGQPPRRLTVVATTPAGMVEGEITRETIKLAAILVIGALLTAVACSLVLRRALAPLEVSAADVTRLASGEIHTLTRTTYLELDLLIDAVNGLLDASRRTVTKSRLGAANMAHALKTPLAALRSRLALVAPGDVQLVEDIGRLDRQITRHLARARRIAAAPLLGEPVRVRAILEDAAFVAERSHAGRGVRISIDVDEDLSVRIEREALEELAGCLVDNAMKWARSTVTITARRLEGGSVLTVEDDGPGMDLAAAARAIEPGARLDETIPGHGLGLAIAADIAIAHGGGLRFDRSRLGGLAVEATLMGIGLPMPKR